VSTRQLVAAAVLATVLAACGTPASLRTAPAAVDACDQALLAGQLVASNLSGLAVRNGDQTTEVLWPFGYAATREAAGLALHDGSGKVVAHEGQRVEMSGGLGANNTWTACAGTIREVPNTGG